MSWRVLIFPMLGYERLYRRFHLDEPWDGAHNRKLIQEMPREFASPKSGLHSKYMGILDTR